jgi:hypothetical protein
VRHEAMPEVHAVDTELTREKALAALAEVSNVWGATWERRGDSGRLELPVLAGLRHGVLAGTVHVEPSAGGSRIVFEIESSRYRLQWSAVAILVLGAAGGIATTLWPYFPPLLGIAPLAVVVAIGAWILVASRLRTSTVEEFLELVAEREHGARTTPPVRAVEP